jgi:hypothetical protein
VGGFRTRGWSFMLRPVGLSPDGPGRALSVRQLLEVVDVAAAGILGKLGSVTRRVDKVALFRQGRAPRRGARPIEVG